MARKSANFISNKIMARITGTYAHIDCIKGIYPAVISAPMAGYTDRAFRRVLIKCGAREVWTEMVSAAALAYRNNKTLEFIKFDKRRHVRTVVQLFGNKPGHFKAAIESGLLDGFDEININMGCPAPKIIKNGEGAALAKNLSLAREIIETCIAVARVPVSVKMRLDYGLALAHICERLGVSRLIVHGRYAKQGYSGIADWEKVGDIVRAVNIPVVANGDVRDSASARECLCVTKAAGVMMGRALIGTPWKISSKRVNPHKIIKFHIRQAIKCHGERHFCEMKKHLLAYCNHLDNSKELKSQIAQCNSFTEAKAVFRIK